jgi:hypothetical protein
MSKFKCEICSKDPQFEEVTLFRQNPLGEIGIWRCDEHNKLAIDPEIRDIVNFTKVK